MSFIRNKYMEHHAQRMDQPLISAIRERWKFLRYIPTRFHGFAEKILARFTKIPVLIQWEMDGIHSLQLHPQHHLRSLGLSARHSFRDIHTSSLPISISHLSKLIELPAVKKVYLDRKMYALLDTAIPTTHSHLAWKITKRGEGVTIAVIDTGIAPHSDVQSRIVAFVDFINRRKSPYDDNGHGTHCAGCAAGDGSSSNGRYRGSAPHANLVGVKVLGKHGEGTLSKVIAGIEWCIQHKDEYNIRIISLSLGSDSHMPYQDDPICQMVEQAWKAGITVVAAAGNEGPKSGTICSPGIDPMIITVGASDDRNTNDRKDDELTSFSSRGPTADGLTKPDVVAPGMGITSLRSPSSYLDDNLPQNRVSKKYFTLSGTSMATPIVAGIAALMIQANPSITPNEVKQKIMQTAFSLGASPNEQGAGLVDAERCCSPDPTS